MMKNFDTPMVTISKEEYDQLKECKMLINTLWRKFGPYDWPREFSLPKNLSWKDLYEVEQEGERGFYQFTQRVNELMKFDDSE